MLLTGHLMAPVLIWMALSDSLPLAASMAIALGLAITLLLSFLQPAKGAVIAVQWWLGMHGFAADPGREQAKAED